MYIVMVFCTELDIWGSNKWYGDFYHFGLSYLFDLLNCRVLCKATSQEATKLARMTSLLHLLLNLNIFRTLFWCVHFWLWTSRYRIRWNSYFISCYYSLFFQPIKSYDSLNSNIFKSHRIRHLKVTEVTTNCYHFGQAIPSNQIIEISQ